MKHFKLYFIIGLSIIMSSCLTAGLEELPVYSDAEITNFKFEYRWADKEGTSDVMRVKPLNTNISIDKDKGEVRCKINVPAAEASGFTEEIRAKVSLNNLIGFCTISTASTIKPLGSSPVLGKPGDFSQSELKYQVTAADNKTKKEWKIIIDSFEK